MWSNIVPNLVPLWEGGGLTITRADLEANPDLVEYIVKTDEPARWDFAPYFAPSAAEVTSGSPALATDSHISTEGDNLEENTKGSEPPKMSKSARKRHNRKAASRSNKARLDAEALLDAEDPLWESFRSVVGKKASATGCKEVDDRVLVQPPPYSEQEKNEIMEAMGTALRADSCHLAHIQSFYKHLASTDSSVADRFKEWKSVPDIVRSYCSLLQTRERDLRQQRIDTWKMMSSDPNYAAISYAEKAKIDTIMNPDSSEAERSQARSELDEQVRAVADEIYDGMNKLLPMEGFSMGSG